MDTALEVIKGFNREMGVRGELPNGVQIAYPYIAVPDEGENFVECVLCRCYLDFEDGQSAMETHTNTRRHQRFVAGCAVGTEIILYQIKTSDEFQNGNFSQVFEELERGTLFQNIFPNSIYAHCFPYRGPDYHEIRDVIINALLREGHDIKLPEDDDQPFFGPPHPPS